MRAQDRSRRYRADLTFHACLYGLRLSPIRYNRQKLFGLENLPYGHRECLAGNIGEIGEPRLANLLPATCLIKINDDVGFFNLEIGRWVVKRNMTIFSNPEKRDIDRSRGQF